MPELSWSRNSDRSDRTRAAREKFPDGKLLPDGRRRADHAYMLRPAKEL